MFCTFGTQITVYSMPALRKCGLVPLVANAILDGHLPIIFGAILEPNFYPFFGVPSLVDFPISLVFLRLGGGFRPVFGRVLDRTFLFIFGSLQDCSRAVFERQIFVTIPSLRMDSPHLLDLSCHRLVTYDTC
jgi:hypothetical protein